MAPDMLKHLEAADSPGIGWILKLPDQLLYKETVLMEPFISQLLSLCSIMLLLLSKLNVNLVWIIESLFVLRLEATLNLLVCCGLSGVEW